MSSKKGLSDVITTVLIILIVIAAVLVVWQFIQKPLTQGGDTVSASAECLQIQLVPTLCKINGTMVSVTYQWKAGSGTLSGSKVILKLDDGSVITSSNSTIPKQLETSVATFMGVTKVAKSASVAAVVKAQSGTEVTCSPSVETITCA